MSQLTTRFRGLFVAIVALALSAGAAFAWGGPPEAANDGLATAAAATGKTVPARADEAPTTGAGEDTEDGDAPEAEAPEDTEDGDAPEAEAPEDESDAGAHGALVSEAAGMETPDGFANHGEFVSCVARMNHGHEDPDAAPSEPVDPSTLTPEDCGLTTEAAAHATKAPKATGKTKDHSTHGKAAQAKGHNR